MGAGRGLGLSKEAIRRLRQCVPGFCKWRRRRGRLGRSPFRGDYLDRPETQHAGLGMCVAQSFSKNFGLYGERVGALHLVVPPHLSAQGAQGELMAIARAEYSNPPRFGASIVETVLVDPVLRSQWEVDLDTMSSRMHRMRHELKNRLEKKTGQD